MGIDLTDRSDLDWLALGRSGDSLSSIFSGDSGIDDDRLRLAIVAELEGLETSREFSRGELETAAKGILKAIGSEETEEILGTVLKDSEASDASGREFMERYWADVAGRIVDRFIEQRKGSSPSGDDDSERLDWSQESLVR